MPTEGGRRRGGRGWRRRSTACSSSGGSGDRAPRRRGRRAATLVGRGDRGTAARTDRRRGPARDDRPRDARTCSSTPRARPAGRRAPSTSTAASRSRAPRTSPTRSTSAAATRLFWFTDLGWMMGPWAISGSLLLGARLVLYEGAPDFPGPDRLWALVARHRVTHLGLSPTVIRALMAHGDGAGPRARPLVAARPRLDRRAVEPRAVVVVLPRGRRGPLPDRQLLRRDRGHRRDRRLATCSTPIKPASFCGPCIGHGGGRRRRRRARRSAARSASSSSARRCPGMTRGFWRDPRALRGDVLVALPGDLGPRRLGDRRRGRLLVHPAAAPTTRSRSPASASGRPRSRARPVAHPAVARGGRDRRPARGQGRGDRRLLRAPPGRDRRRRRCAPRSADGRRGPARQAAQAGGRRRRPRPAQDALGQGHAPRRRGPPGSGLDPGDLSALDDPTTLEAIRRGGATASVAARRRWP